MFNLFGSSMLGRMGNSVVENRLAGSQGLRGGVESFGQQQGLFGNNIQDPNQQPTPADLQTLQEPSGDKGVKKILGAVFPLLGAAFAIHDAHQAREQQIFEANQQ